MISVQSDLKIEVNAKGFTQITELPFAFSISG